ncbi:ubiquitin fusion degradation protein [Dimargaris verticillata]|uniref:Ubiquitin fusion degradation protein 1 n=1 Tax=Dimargaris verticillata TaxID=2761393 RepID=A0A9W8B2Z6_9FUNG|nr:ubiquitin fusion degradation protein [Dimargaris verticillata]
MDFGGPETNFGLSSWLNAGSGRAQTFEEHFRCYPVVMMDSKPRDNVCYGGKLLLPPSALDKLTRLNIMYPMLFQLTNENTDCKQTNAGVLEFTAEEGRVYLPQWMMQTLLLEPGDLVKVKSTSLPLGRYVKIQPQSVEFLDISDPRAVLENALRNFSTLTVGDIITISYNDKLFDILVLETKPSASGISIVETDLEVDFAPPLGYQEPKPVKPVVPTMASQLHLPDARIASLAGADGSGAFQGGGHRLKTSPAKVSTLKNEPTEVSSSTTLHSTLPANLVASDNAPAPLNLPLGQLFFGYQVVPPANTDTNGTEVRLIYICGV